MDLGDQVAQHRVPDRTLGRGTFAVLVEPRLRDPQDRAGNLDRAVLRGDHLDRRVPAFGLVSSFSRSTAF